jgi:hypothetical protein
MTRANKAQAEIQSQLPEGETVLMTAPCQIKTGKKAKRFAKNAALGVGVSVAMQVAGAGIGLAVVSVPTPMWVVVTDRRVRIFVDTGLPVRRVGKLVFDAPRTSVTLSDSVVAGVLREIRISNRETNDVLVRLNLGIRKQATAQVMQAAA